MGNLVRAIRRLVLWQLVPGEKLIRFIDENLDESALCYLQQKEAELFSYCVSTYWNSAEEAKKFLFQDRKLENVQLELFQAKHKNPYSG
jgi:hypothetical protein